MISPAPPSDSSVGGGGGVEDIWLWPSQRSFEARRVGRSRSRVYAEALAEYLKRHGPDEVTAAMNAVVDEVGEVPDGFVEAAARRTLERVEW